MADAITIQELIDARTDAKTLEEAVNGDAVTTVLSRLGETYPTLSNALNQIDSKLDSADAQVKQGITNLFENGGLPATPFTTKAKMTASALIDGKYAMVTDDTLNNGFYVKTAGNWVKSSYDPSLKAIDFFKSSSDLHLLPSSSTGVNYDVASKTLSFEGSVRLINGSTNIVVPTPSSITFPGNGLYRIIYDHSTLSLGFDVYHAPHKSKQSFVAVCDVTAIGFVAYGIPQYTVNGKANTVKTEGSYYGNVTTNWVFSNVLTTNGSPSSVGVKNRLLSDLIPLKGVIDVTSADPNIRVRLMVYNKDGSASHITPGDITTSAKVDGYYRVLVAYEDSSDLELTDADKVSITTRANIPDELIKRTEVIPNLEPNSISNISGQTISSANTFRTIDFIKMTGTISVKPINPDAEIRLHLYDKDKVFIKSLGYVPEFSNVDVDGYFKITVRYRLGKEGDLTPDALAVKVVAVSLHDSLSSGSSSTPDALNSLPSSATYKLNSGDMWRDKNKLSYTRNTPTFLDSPNYKIFNTHADVYAFTDRLVADFPDYVSKFTVGVSEKGLPIYGYKLTPKLFNKYSPSSLFPRYIDFESYMPKLILSGGTHGIEVHSVIANLLFIDDLCRQWMDIENYAEIRWGMQIIFIPLLNPDGYNSRKRENSNGVDLNRSFGTSNPPAETQSMMELMSNNADAIAYIDHHRCFASSAKVWVGIDDPSYLGLTFKYIRDVSINTRIVAGNVTDTSPMATITRTPDVSTTGWNYATNNVASFLLETPDNVGVGDNWGKPTILHARDAVATLIGRLYDAEIKRLEREGFDNPF